jgi:hypothetical protein
MFLTIATLNNSRLIIYFSRFTDKLVQPEIFYGPILIAKVGAPCWSWLMQARKIKLALIGATFALAAVTSASAATITLVSDGSTMAAETPLTDIGALLTGDTSGLAFGADVVGAEGTFTAAPTGSPSGTEVINISATGGASGLFEIAFSLPAGFINPHITGSARIDDYGGIFLNGHNLGSAGEFADYPFSSADASFFRAGTNEFVVSDANGKGGPSGAAFYATISFDASAAPEPSAWAFLITGVALVGCALRRVRSPADPAKANA